MCAKQACDETISRNQEKVWHAWKKGLSSLETLSIYRCYKNSQSKIREISLHTYSDASSTGYGTAIYLRQVSENDEVFLSFVIAKSRVAPLKEVTIPRLE